MTADAAPTIPAPSPPVADTNNTRTKNKWVINLTNTPLATAQETLLARGPNFAIVPE